MDSRNSVTCTKPKRNLIYLILLTFLIKVQAVPLTNPDQSSANSPNPGSPQEFGDNDVEAVSKGCRYKAVSYSAGEQVHTQEPCLLCKCSKSSAVVCKLRVCPDLPDPPPPGCITVHKAGKCCPKLVCPESPRKISREQRLPPVNLTALNSSTGFCVSEGTRYAEGSAMRSSKPCESCFCIRGQAKCSKPKCVIPAEGCKGVYAGSFACCPTKYKCDASNSSAIVESAPANLPGFLKGCQVRGQWVKEGDPVLPLALFGPNDSVDPCQTCFCMGGIIVCRPLDCARPLDGCSPIKMDGHCCADSYECDRSSPPLTDNLLKSSRFLDDVPATTQEVTPAVEESDSDSPEPTTILATFDDPIVSVNEPEEIVEEEEESTPEVTTLEATTELPEMEISSSFAPQFLTFSSTTTSTTTPAPKTEATTLPSTTVEPVKPPPSPSQVEYIKFGLEDANIPDLLMMRNYPTPRGYINVPLEVLRVPPSPEVYAMRSPPMTPSPKNAPSSSLYSNGFFRYGLFKNEGKQPEPMQEVKLSSSQTLVPSHRSEVKAELPPRVYSKFGIQDRLNPDSIPPVRLVHEEKVAPPPVATNNAPESEEYYEEFEVMEAPPPPKASKPPGPLRLSGCNVYGKMYLLHHPIKELSSNCALCKCTEQGVTCEQTC